MDLNHITSVALKTFIVQHQEPHSPGHRGTLLPYTSSSPSYHPLCVQVAASVGSTQECRC